MRKLSAHYIFPADRPPLKYGIIVVDDDGTIIELIDTGGKAGEASKLEFYPGVLVPGLVNAHCHLELSHMKDIIPKRTGMTGFIDRIGDQREADIRIIKKTIEYQAEKMYQSGVSAVADIVNTQNTISVKEQSGIYWHNFIELFGLIPENAPEIWEKGLILEKTFRESGLTAGICPHAPYSISSELWKQIGTRKYRHCSIHNQESRDEEDLMTLRKGNMKDWFNRKGYNPDVLPPGKETSLKSYLPLMPEADKVMFIHNTYSSYPDFEIAESRYGKENVFWVSCPNANLYIEGKLPHELYAHRFGRQLCIGTDSLASNSSLSMIGEMITIQKHYPDIDFRELLKWASINGARALGIDKQYGSLAPGKKPGIVLVKGMDLNKMTLGPESVSQRLI